MDDQRSPRRFKTLGPRGLDPRLPPLRLFQKAKKFGIWDPQAIDLSRDRQDWLAMSPLEQEVILHLIWNDRLSRAGRPRIVGGRGLLKASGSGKRPARSLRRRVTLIFADCFLLGSSAA